MSDVTSETPEESAFFESEGAKEVPAEAIPDDVPEQAKEPVKEAKAEEPKKAEVPMVPIHALHEARAELREYRDKAAKMEARFEEFVKRASTPQEQPKTIDEDPLGTLKQHQAEIDEWRQWKAQQEQQSQHQTQIQRMMQTYSNMATEYQAKTPDFKDAYNHWMGGLKDELVDLGYTDWQQQIEQMELNIVAKAIQDGANPAERIYAAAKRRGFKVPVKEDPAKRFEQLQRGQSAAKSLGNLSGDQEPPLTLQSLAEMDDEDFDKNWDKVMKANRR